MSTGFDPGSLYDTIQADAMVYGATKRHTLVVRIEPALFFLTMRRDTVW